MITRIKELFNKYIRQNLGLKVLSVFLAIILWLIARTKF